MLGRLFKRNPYTRKRAEALTVDFLNKHKAQVSGRAFAGHVLANVETRCEDEALHGFGPHAQAQLGHYPVYAVHLARHSLGSCTALMPDSIDGEGAFLMTAMAIHRGLGTDAETAGQLLMQTLEERPRKEEGGEFDEAEIAALPEGVRRLVLIEEIARSDATIILEAFANGDKSVDLSDHDIDPLAELLDLSVIPDPDHERLAAEIKRKQSRS